MSKLCVWTIWNTCFRPTVTKMWDISSTWTNTKERPGTDLRRAEPGGAVLPTGRSRDEWSVSSCLKYSGGLGEKQTPSRCPRRKQTKDCRKANPTCWGPVETCTENCLIRLWGKVRIGCLALGSGTKIIDHFASEDSDIRH